MRTRLLLLEVALHERLAETSVPQLLCEALEVAHGDGVYLFEHIRRQIGGLACDEPREAAAVLVWLLERKGSKVARNHVLVPAACQLSAL